MFLRVLKITATGVNKFYRAYPDLVYGDAFAPHIDMFNHGVMDGVWHGEDYDSAEAIARSAAMYGASQTLRLTIIYPMAQYLEILISTCTAKIGAS